LIVAQGWEAGGHVWGEVSTLALVPAVVDAARSTPVVAAGGIGDGRGLAAVLALGAGGAWMGTRFVASVEAPAHPEWTARIVRSAETATFYSKVFDGGWPDAAHRVLRNSTVEAWLAAGSPSPGARPGEGEVIARGADGSELRRYGSDSVRANVRGDVEALSMWAGQSVGVIHEVLPAAEIVHRTVADAERILANLGAPGGVDGQG
jgi:nitronate monooxygenase